MKQLLVGRLPDNDIVLNDPYVSRHHCTINLYEDGRVGVMDLGSKTGTFVNGTKITGEYFLQPGDVLQTGATVIPWQNYISDPSFSTKDTQVMHEPGPGGNYGAGPVAGPSASPGQDHQKAENKEADPRSSSSPLENLYIPKRIFNQLTPLVQQQLLKLSPDLQHQFLEEYRRKSKSVFLAYLFFFLFGLHYAYLNKWGTQILYWLTFAGLIIWGIIDLFRMPSLVRNYNREKALEIIQQIKILTQ